MDLQFQGDLGLIRQAVWSCYQEGPVEFRGQQLFDTGAYPEPPLSGRITWKVTQPWGEPRDDAERAARKRAFELMDLIRERKKRQRET